MRPAARRLALACCTLGAVALPHPASAADIIYAVITGLQGESAVVQGAIDVQSVSTGVSAAATTGVGAGGPFRGHTRANFADLNLSLVVSAVSPVLAHAVASGEHFAEAVISFAKPKGDRPEAYLVYTLTNVVITSYSVGGAAGGSRPSESVSLSYTKIKFEYKTQRPDGTLDKGITSCWDLERNHSC